MASTINGIKISDGEFTKLQERATAYILKRAFHKGVKFNTPQAIIDDKITNTGLVKIFKFDGKNLFQLSPKKYKLLPTKAPERKWMDTFWQQQSLLITKYANAGFTHFDRDGKNGFMDYIIDLIKEKYNIGNKDTWNPADIWLVKNQAIVEQKINKATKKVPAKKGIKKLNVIMRKMLKEQELVGVSLKLISGKAQYKLINADYKFLSDMDKMTGSYHYQLSKIVYKLSLKATGKDFITQDCVVFLKNSDDKDFAKFQIKGNGTSALSNLKIEGTEIGASSAKLGKAPLNLVQDLSTDYISDIFTSTSRDHKNYPITRDDFNEREDEFNQMFIKVFDHIETDIGLGKVGNPEEGGESVSEFIYNMRAVFGSETSSGPKYWFANSKLMQLYFIHKLIKFDPENRDAFLTDLLFLSQKQGRKVFDFGPFGKLY
jgi:hypothetical protein